MKFLNYTSLRDIEVGESKELSILKQSSPSLVIQPVLLPKDSQEIASHLLLHCTAKIYGSQ